MRFTCRNRKQEVKEGEKAADEPDKACCEEVDSSKGLKYEDILNHMKQCKFDMFACPLNCDDVKEGFLITGLDDHLKICKKA